MKEFFDTLYHGLSCRCPRCQKGEIFTSHLNPTLQDKCPQCDFDLTKSDGADGPAVFLIFMFGFLLVPLALILDAWVEFPLWLHAILWSIIMIALTLLTLKPLKSYILFLQYKHRPTDWDKS